MPPLQPTDVPSFYGCVETTGDALRLIQAARNGLIPRIVRRLNEVERRSMIMSGAVFVFNVEESNIRRWTEGLQWSPSRIAGNFLVYREVTERGASRTAGQRGSGDNSQRQDINAMVRPGGLTKKTITVKIEGSDHHLISYYLPEDVESGRLTRPVTRPDIMALEIPPDLVQSTNFRYPPRIEAGPDGRLTQIRDADEDLLTEGSTSTTHRLGSPRSPPMRVFDPISDSPARTSSTRSPESPSSPRRFGPYPIPPQHSTPDVRAGTSNVPPLSPSYYPPPPQAQHDTGRSMWPGQYPPYETHAEPPFPYPYSPQTSSPPFQPTHERRSWNRRSSGVSRVEGYHNSIEGQAFEGQGSDMAWAAEGSRQPYAPSASSSTSPRLPTAMRRQEDHTRTHSVSSTWSAEHHGSVQTHSPVSPPMYDMENPPREDYSPTSSRGYPYDTSGGSRGS